MHRKSGLGPAGEYQPKRTESDVVQPTDHPESLLTSESVESEATEAGFADKRSSSSDSSTDSVPEIPPGYTVMYDSSGNIVNPPLGPDADLDSILAEYDHDASAANDTSTTAPKDHRKVVVKGQTVPTLEAAEPRGASVSSSKEQVDSDSSVAPVTAESSEASSGSTTETRYQEKIDDIYKKLADPTVSESIKDYLRYKMTVIESNTQQEQTEQKKDNSSEVKAETVSKTHEEEVEDERSEISSKIAHLDEQIEVYDHAINGKPLREGHERAARDQKQRLEDEKKKLQKQLETFNEGEKGKELVPYSENDDELTARDQDPDKHPDNPDKAEEGSEEGLEHEQQREAYDAAVAELAKLRADAETKSGNFITYKFKKSINWILRRFGKQNLSIIGRERREQKLREAEDKVKECALALAKSRAENIENTADLSEDEIAQMKSDAAFGELRSLLDVNVRQAINDELTERQEKRHFGDKLLASVGKWLNGGSKWGRRLRNFGPGFATGALLPVFGVSNIPVLAGVTTVAGSLIHRGSRLAAADENLKRHQDDEGKAKAQFDAAEVAKMREEAEKMTASRPDDGKEAIGHFADWMMHSSRQKSYEDADRAAKEAETNAGLFALGAGLGKLANLGAHTALEKWSTDASAASAPETEAPSSGNETANADLSPSGDSGNNKTLNDAMDRLTHGSDGSGGEALTNADFSAYEDQFPWNWAADNFGTENAASKLHELADMAAQNGYDVEWHGSGANEWVSINGDSNTTSVLKVLSQYAKK
jgi:hypothetical protein